MLTELYIESLLVNEELADQVWQAWDKGEIDDEAACLAWAVLTGFVFLQQLCCVGTSPTWCC